MADASIPLNTKRAPTVSTRISRVHKIPVNSRFEVLPSDNDDSSRKVNSAGSTGRGTDTRADSSRGRNSASGNKSRLDSATGRRTPTKQVVLQTTKKKLESSSSFGDIDWNEDSDNTEEMPERFKSLEIKAKPNSHDGDSAIHLSTDDVDEDNSQDSSEEDDETKAPNQLLMEFTDCLMDEDYENAQKLCKMILIYEPTNPEALEYQPLIEEKLMQEAEESDDSSTDEEDDDDDDEDDDDEDDDEDDEDEDDDDDDEDDSDTSDEGSDDDNYSTKLDSGVASASEECP